MLFKLTPEGLQYFTQKNLTKREIEIIEAMINLPSNKEIGAALFVTEKCVKFHLTHIYKKLGYKNRVQTITSLIRYFAGSESYESPTKKIPEKLDFTKTLGSSALPRGTN